MMRIDNAVVRLRVLAEWEHQRYDRTGVSDIELDARACEAAAEVLHALTGEGAKDVREAVNLIRSQPLAVRKYRKLHGHFETAQNPQPRPGGGVMCPSCFSRVGKAHYYCPWCGKQLKVRKRGTYGK